jgi:hypothetical protein
MNHQSEASIFSEHLGQKLRHKAEEVADIALDWLLVILELNRAVL